MLGAPVTPTAFDLIAWTQGCRRKAYQDEGGVWTIGRGHTGPEVHEGLEWTIEQIDEATLHDLSTATQAAIKCVGVVCFVGLDAARKAALIDAAFTLGQTRLSRFHNMLGAIERGDWDKARAECINSAWYGEDPRECRIVADMLLTGEWPAELTGAAGAHGNPPTAGTEKVA